MGKSIWDQLGDFAGVVGNDIGGAVNGIGQAIGGAVNGVEQGIGGLIHGGEQAIGSLFGGGQQQAPQQPQYQQAPGQMQLPQATQPNIVQNPMSNPGVQMALSQPLQPTQPPPPPPQPNTNGKKQDALHYIANLGHDALQNGEDFVSNVAGSALKSAAQGTDTLYNNLTDGFDAKTTQDRTNQFLNDLSLNDLGKGTSPGAQLGSYIGNVVGGIVPGLVNTPVNLAAGVGTNLGAANFDTSGIKDPEAKAAVDNYLAGQTIDPRQTLVNAGETALEVATDGASKLAEGLLGQTAGKYATGAGIGGLFMGGETARDPNATPLDYIKNTALGAITGVGFPAVGDAAHAGTPDGVAHRELMNTDPTYATAAQTSSQLVKDIFRAKGDAKQVLIDQKASLDKGMAQARGAYWSARQASPQGGYIGAGDTANGPGNSKQELSTAIDHVIAEQNPGIFERNLYNGPTGQALGENGSSAIPKIHTADLQHYFGDTSILPSRYKRSTGPQDLDELAQRAGHDDVDSYMEAIQNELATRKASRENTANLAALRKDPAIIQEAQRRIAEEHSKYGDPTAGNIPSEQDLAEYDKQQRLNEASAPKPTMRVRSQPTTPTDPDVIAQSLGLKPSAQSAPDMEHLGDEAQQSVDASTEPSAKETSLAGQKAVYEVSRSGGSLDDAIAAYKEATGAAPKEAREQATRMFQPAKNAIDPAGSVEQNPLLKHYQDIFGHQEATDEGARLKAQAMHDEVTEKLNTALKAGKELSDRDKASLRDIEHTDPQSIVDQADDPVRMAKTINALRDYYDTEHALAAISGDVRPYNQNYLAHVYEHEADDPTTRESELRQDSKHQKERVFNSYQDAAKNGFNPKYGNALHDALDHHLSNVGKMRANAFFNDMAALHPDQVSRTSSKQGGQNFIQSKLFGNQGRSIFLHPDLAEKVNRFAQPEKTVASTRLGKTAQGLVKGYDVLNRASKQLLLAGGGFHLMNTGFYAITHPMALLEHVMGSDERYARTPAERNLAGLTADSSALNSDFRSGGAKANEYDKMIDKAVQKTTDGQKVISVAKKTANITHTLTFDVGIKNFKESIFDRATRGLDFSNPDDLAQARKIAGTVNDFFGGVNRLMDGTISPKVFKVLSRTVLAPDFMEGQFRALGRSAVGTAKVVVGKGDRADRLAAQTMVGRIVLVAAGVTAANALINPENRQLDGKKIFQDFLNNLLDPEVQTSIKKKNGQYQSVSLPSTPLNIIAHAVGPMFNGDPDPLSGVKHEAVARTAAGARIISGLATNQDYYGNPLYGHDAAGNPISAGQTAKNLIGETLPIPASSAISSTKSGTQPVDLTKTAIAVAGGRLHNDPTDPITLSNNQYYSMTNKATAGMSTDELNAWKVIHPQTKDSDGNYLVQPSYFDKSEKADLYLAHPSLLAADSQVNQAMAAQGQKVDPFWTKLTPDQQKAVLEYQRMPPGGADETAWKQQNASWYTLFEKERADFFNSLPPGDPNKPQLPLQPPKSTPAIENAFTQLNQLSNPQDKAKFINSNSDLSNYLDQMGQYTNNLRVAQGYDKLRDFPKADPTTQKFMTTYFAADKATQKLMRTSSPDLFNNMEMNLAQVARYSMDKAAADDQLIRPGQDENASPSQEYLKNAYNLGKYDIAKGTNAAGGTLFSFDPGAAYAQNIGQTFSKNGVNYAGNKSGASYKKYSNANSAYYQKAQQYKMLRYARDAGKVANRSNNIHVYTPSQLKRLSKVVTVGTHQPKIKGSLRVTRRKLTI